MGPDLFDYNKIVDGALRGVVREALRRVAEHGLRGAHHFYITFRTDAPGVDIPEFLRTKFPVEMTIIVQYQFWDLEVDEDKFSISLSFSKTPQRLTIPFSALRGFADPSVKFGLQFQGEEGEIPAAAPALAASGSESAAPAPKPPSDPADKVVTLDAFRKK